MNPCTDVIVIQKGLHINQQAELIIQEAWEADGGGSKIVIPYRTDLTNFGIRLRTLENGSGSGSGVTWEISPDLVIEKIKAINPYVWINECYYLFDSIEQLLIMILKDSKIWWI
jgi:hypothetical protein